MLSANRSNGSIQKAKRGDCGCGWNKYSSKKPAVVNTKGQKVIRAFPKK